jgi:hypothetical protein
MSVIRLAERVGLGALRRVRSSGGGGWDQGCYDWGIGEIRYWERGCDGISSEIHYREF